MSWTLATPDGTSLEVNAWNRRPTVELPERAGVIDAETAGLLGYTIDVDLSGEQARRVADFLDEHLAGLPDDGRVLLDGSTTTEPDTYDLHRDDLSRNHSATAGQLRTLRDFCRAATGGFTVG